VTTEELRTHGQGLPGVIHHIVRYCIEGGALPSAATSVADLIAGRLDALPHGARQVLQAAAVLGTEVERSDLDAIFDGELGPEELEEALEILSARELLRLEDTVWVFGAPVVRNVTCDAIPVSARRELHARAFELLSSRISDPAVLGHHAQLSGELDRGAELLCRAGDSAFRYLDHTGACALYNRALVAARQHVLADGGNGARLRFVNISIRLADALRSGGESSLARGVVEEARIHADGVPILRAQLLRSAAHLSAESGELQAAVQNLQEAIGSVIPHGATDLLCELYLDLAAMSLRLGRLDIASQELAEAVDLITAGEGGAAATGPRALWRLLLRLAQLYAAEGKPRKAIPLAEHAHRHANNASSRLGAARAQAFLAGQFEHVGNQAKAAVYRRRAVDALRALGDRRGTAELLLSAVRITKSVGPVTPSGLREARLLAEEVGWTEGVRRARRASEAPPGSDSGSDA